MDVIPLLVLCSLVLVGAALLVFLWSVRNRDLDHADRLSLLPLEPDDFGADDAERTAARRD
jgi:cbb3-type cytochrome oxidase maturation protein